jgi:hypothetical protein
LNESFPHKLNRTKITISDTCICWLRSNKTNKNLNYCYILLLNSWRSFFSITIKKTFFYYQIESCVAAAFCQSIEDFSKKFWSQGKNQFVGIHLFVCFAVKDYICCLTL